MITRLRESRTVKGICLLLALNMLSEMISPMTALALTGGAAQPEFSSFTPIGTSDMVDLSSGDFNYNIPIMDVGGYPLNLAYSSGISMDQEASWVGLGWNMNVGQITRQVRGIPDDFNGDNIRYENNLKTNVTVGGDFNFQPAVFGADIPDNVNLSVGVGIKYNNYEGVSITPSVGASVDLGDNASVGFNISSGPDGMSISPKFSVHAKMSDSKRRDNKLGLSIGTSFNSRQGLSSVNMSVSTEQSKANAKALRKNSTFGSGSGSLGSSISLMPNTYTPAKRVPMNNGNFTFGASIGTEVFGGEFAGSMTGFGSYQKIKSGAEDITEKAYGYEHTEKAGNSDILDFNREKDGNFSINSTNLPLTNYTYDLYSVQGQGVSGQFRPYRNQVGYIYDQYVSDDGVGTNLGVEIGATNTVHIGVDIKVSPTNSYSGIWQQNNPAKANFEDVDGNAINEKVYFKNVGDLSADFEYDIFENDLGEYRPIRIGFGGGEFNRATLNRYEAKSSSNALSYDNIALNGDIKRTKRVKRNQAIERLKYSESQNYGFAKNNQNIISSNAKAHHTTELRVLRNDGARYVYGLPAYNNTKREVTFSMAGESGDCGTGLITYQPNEDNSVDNDKGDKYFERITTDPYVHTFLLTSVLSTDYEDTDGIPGPSQGDLGSYTDFEYRKVNNNFHWRVPYLENKANYNEGLKSNYEDEKGSYVYGTKELWYIKKIETKTHVALFKISRRHDAQGVNDENGAAANTVTSSKMYKLDEVALYSRGEFYDANGNIVGEGVDSEGNITTTATPIKVAHFEYNYDLCKGIPNNDGSSSLNGNETSNNLGKLTLQKVYFTYRNSKMGKYTGYHFNYDNINPNYNLKAYDTWGCYKENEGASCAIDGPITAPEFNYVDQDQSQQDEWTAAWTMSSIDLPSGGKIELEYESDDYKYVQNKRAMRMFKVIGAGQDPMSSSSPISNNDEALLYGNGSTGEAKYLYVKLPEGVTTVQDVKENCLAGMENNLIYFRFLLNMVKKGGKTNNWDAEQFDYVSGYFKLDGEPQVYSDGTNYYASIPMEMQEMEGGLAGSLQVNPISKAGWHYGRKYLNRIVYGIGGNSSTDSFEGVITQLLGVQTLTNAFEVFAGPNGALRAKQSCRRFIPSKSWIRMYNPTDAKLGGGCRVKTVKMQDEWDVMTGNENDLSRKEFYRQEYGQQYEYELEDGSSSGVATYEPVGNKENPFVQPVYVSENRLLAPDEENYIEKPFGESFFPSPSVTYSRVKVKNLERSKDIDGDAFPDVVRSHATGEVVTEFYTSKDYPTIVDQTELKAEEDKTGLLGNLLKLNVRKHLTLSQGYTIHKNDMNGKQKSQRVFAEGQEDYISGVDYLYEGFTSSVNGDPFSLVSNTTGKLNNEVTIITPNGVVSKKTIGVEYDVVNDFRENGSSTQTVGVNTNLATFLVGIFPGIVPVPLPSYSQSSDKFNSVSTTKVINTFGILRETVAHDAGASVSTKNIAWDGYTGEVLLTETTNEYGDRYFSFNYPAHWYYSGMSQAVNNLELTGTLDQVTSGDTYYYSELPSINLETYFEPGDELWLSNSNRKAWVTKIVSSTELKLIDIDGLPITDADGEPFKVIRSGRRNIQSTSMASVTSLINPIDLNSDGILNNITPSTFEASNWSQYRIVNASAVEFDDNWSFQCECGLPDPESEYNPFLYNERGIWRAKRSHLYLTGRYADPSDPTPRKDGFMVQFSPFYSLNTNGKWEIDNTNWTFTSEVSQYSPWGFELENEDALHRFSAAQYGYNNVFPMAVGANTQYQEIGFDGFEDYNFDGCNKRHFGFEDIINSGQVVIDNQNSHTGHHSIKVGVGSRATIVKPIGCPPEVAQP